MNNHNLHPTDGEGHAAEPKTPGFTPGPWKVSCGVSWSNVYDGRDNCVAHCSDSAWITDAEAAANARLIAAAPDLYAALHFIVNDAKEGEDAQLTVDGYNRACDAIAKAGGK